MSSISWVLISWPMLILLGIALRMSLRLLYGARGPGQSDPIHGYLTIVSWVLIVIGMLPVLVGGIYTVFGAVILLMAIFTIIEIVTQRRATQRRSLCTLLALLVERRQRLDSSALLASHAMRGRVGRSATKLFNLLDAGMPLEIAVRTNPRALPREAIAYLAAGTTSDTESAALRELSQTDQSEVTTVWRACVDRITYLACVLTFMVMVLTFVMIKIVPAFVDIFSEFGLDLPPLTQLAVTCSHFFVNYLAVPLVFAIVITIVGGSIIGVCYLLDIAVLRPVTDRLFRGRRLSDILRILAVSTEHREPLADVLKKLAIVYPSGTIRRQLVPVAQAIESGEKWPAALLKSDVVRAPESSLLKSAERAANLPWAFRQIARRREKRAVYRLSTALQVAYPLVILLLGLLVGFFVISLFIPLVHLIQGLSM